MSRTLTTDQFIEKARAIHGDKYDYSKVNYVNSHKAVVIMCPDHGEFKHSPNNHLLGRGCRRCCKNHRLATEKFIVKARLIHGDKYDYSTVKYIGCYTNIIIMCPEHGEFKHTPHSHLRGHGCRKCANKAHKNRFMTTDQDFIKKATSIHGDNYDFSKFKYDGNRDNISTVVCKKHGEFEATGHNILKATKGLFCKKCRNEHVQNIHFKKAYGNISMKDHLISLLSERKYCINVDFDKIPDDLKIIGKHLRIELFCKKHERFLIDIGTIRSNENCGCPYCKTEDGQRGKITCDDSSYLSYEEAKNFVRNLRIKTQDEYDKWWNKNKPKFLPKYPNRYYKKYN